MFNDSKLLLKYTVADRQWGFARFQLVIMLQCFSDSSTQLQKMTNVIHSRWTHVPS